MPIAYGKDVIYLAWEGNDESLYVASSTDGKSFNGKHELAKTTVDEESSEDAGPALTGTSDRLYLAWVGRDDHLNVVESHDGRTFENKRTLKDSSPHTATPSLIYGDGFFYLSWIGHDDK